MVSTTYDPDAEALYIKYHENKKVAKTIHLGNDVYIDLSSTDQLLGIEIILPNKPDIEDKISSVSGLEILTQTN